MDPLREFGKHRVQNNKKTVKLKVTVFTISLCMNALLILLSSFLYTSQQQAFSMYGEWRMVLPYLYEKEEEHIKEHDIQGFSYSKDSIKKQLKDGSYEDLGSVAGLDKQAEQLFHIKMLKGRLPKDKKEIAVEETVLSSLGIDFTLGKEITLPFKESVTKTYILSGIIKPYRYRWSLEDQSIIPSAIVKDKTGDKILWMSNDTYKKYKSLFPHGSENTFAYQAPVSYTKNANMIFMVVTLSLLLLMIVVGVIRLLFSGMKKELTILYHLGISSKDAKRIRLWTLYYTARYSILLGMISSIGIAMFVSMQLPSAFFVRIPYIPCILCSLILLIISFFSIPMHKLRDKNKIKKVVHRPYIKSSYRKFNPLTYTLRMIQMHKITFIVIVLITSLLLFVQAFCVFKQILLIEKSKIELSQTTDFDFIVSFDVPEQLDEIIGVNKYDVQQMHQIKELKDIITIKQYYQDYNFPSKRESIERKTYQNYLDEKSSGIAQPYILGISKSNQANKILSVYDEQGLFWKQNSALFYNMYFSIDIENADENEMSLTVSPNEYVSYGEEMIHNLKEHNIKKGSFLKYEKNKKLSVIGSVETFDFEQMFSKLNISPYSVITNMKTFDLMYPKHESVQYMYIKANDNANFTTDTQVMNNLHKYQGISIENHLVHKEEIQDALSKGRLLYSLIQGLTLCLYIVLIARLNNMLQKQEMKNRDILYHMGVNSSFFVKANMIETTIMFTLVSVVVYPFSQKMMHSMWFEIVNQNNVFMLSDYINDYVVGICSFMVLFMVVVYVMNVVQTKRRR